MKWKPIIPPSMRNREGHVMNKHQTRKHDGFPRCFNPSYLPGWFSRSQTLFGNAYRQALLDGAPSTTSVFHYVTYGLRSLILKF
jgi:hypothetical protein